jgi:hypothetical protein
MRSARGYMRVHVEHNMPHARRASADEFSARTHARHARATWRDARADVSPLRQRALLRRHGGAIQHGQAAHARDAVVARRRRVSLQGGGSREPELRERGERVEGADRRPRQCHPARGGTTPTVSMQAGARGATRDSMCGNESHAHPSAAMHNDSRRAQGAAAATAARVPPGAASASTVHATSVSPQSFSSSERSSGSHRRRSTSVQHASGLPLKFSFVSRENPATGSRSAAAGAGAAASTPVDAAAQRAPPPPSSRAMPLPHACSSSSEGSAGSSAATSDHAMPHPDTTSTRSRPYGNPAHACAQRVSQTHARGRAPAPARAARSVGGTCGSAF